MRLQDSVDNSLSDKLFHLNWWQAQNVTEDNRVVFSQVRCWKILSLRSAVHKARDAKD